MSLALACLVGGLLGALHLWLFALGVSGLLACQGSGAPRRRWGAVASLRWAITVGVGGAAVVLGELPPVGVALGFLLVFWAARFGLWCRAPGRPATKERSV